MQELIEPMITGTPYPIKGLVLYGTNLFHTVPNVPRTKKALQNLDFVLAIDVLPQDHIAWSDVVFPEATYLERYDELWACGHKTPYIALREPAIEPLYQTKPGWWMARELGLRLGLETFFPWQTAEEYLNQRLSSIGLDLDQLRKESGVIIQKGKPYLANFEATGASPFNTPSRKVELYSEALSTAGHSPLPEYEPPAEGPAGYFRLLYGRSPVHTFARTQNTPALHELQPENEVWVNDAVAARLGLKDGRPGLAGKPGRGEERPDRGQSHASHPAGLCLYGARLRSQRARNDPCAWEGCQRRHTANTVCPRSDQRGGGAAGQLREAGPGGVTWPSGTRSPLISTAASGARHARWPAKPATNFP